MKTLFRKLKQMTGCTYLDLSRLNACTKQYIHILISNPTGRNNSKLLAFMNLYLVDRIKYEQRQFEQRMEDLEGLRHEINSKFDEVIKEESA